MRKPLGIVAALAVAASLAASPAYAWGAAAHRDIMERAIALLPPDIKAFFEQYRDELVLRANDPDLWRLVFPDEAPNHQLDLGVDDYGAYPFTALPREYDEAVQKFGAATVKRHGTLPWRVMEMYGNLRRAMEGFARNQQYANEDAVFYAAALGHYLQDASEPLHDDNNYDGQMTGQPGVHSRFESELFERFRSRLTIKPAPIRPVPSARDFIFQLILDSHQQVPAILKADKQAAAGKDVYDDEYFERFFGAIRPVLERQLDTAVTATASMIVGAWTDAGRPALTTASRPRPLRRVGRR